MSNDDKGNQQVGDPSQSNSQKPEESVTYSISPGFVQFLAEQHVAVALTSYQSGLLYLIGRNPQGGVMINQQGFQKAMGLYRSGDSLMMATLGHIYRMENILNEGQVVQELFTQCYLPRAGHFTGALDAHDVGVDEDGEIIFVNTGYNCLAKLSHRESFKPVWKPDFVSKIVAEDRCHLNGLAMHEGKPAFVTAVSKSNTIDGWRDRRSNGGIVIDVQNNRIICDGLSMPHSPRMHDGKLWVLNSGTGELGHIEGHDTDQGEFVPLCFCPGFVRGLSFHGRYAFVGLSKPRYERFEGLDLDKRLTEADSEPWCGIQVIDTTNGECVQWFRIDGAISELYDVAVLPGVICPMSVSPMSNDAMSLITVEGDANQV